MVAAPAFLPALPAVRAVAGCNAQSPCLGGGSFRTAAWRPDDARPLTVAAALISWWAVAVGASAAIARRTCGKRRHGRRVARQAQSEVQIVQNKAESESKQGHDDEAAFFAPWLDFIRQQFVEGLDLREEPLPSELAFRIGQRESSAQAAIRNWVYVSDCPDSPVRCLRVTLVSNGERFQALNVALYPALSRGPLPILAIDLLSFSNHRRQLFGVDWAPMSSDEGYIDEHIAPHIQHVRFGEAAELASEPSTKFYGKDPEFFSPLMFFARPAGSEALLPGSGLWHVFSEYCQRYREMLTARPGIARGGASAAMDRQVAYEHFHDAHDPASMVLSKVFGEEWTQEWLQHCCFPAALSGKWFGVNECSTSGEKPHAANVASSLRPSTARSFVMS